MQICSRQICAGTVDREVNPDYMEVFKLVIPYDYAQDRSNPWLKI